jgi:hypothetical protein
MTSSSKFSRLNFQFAFNKQESNVLNFKPLEFKNCMKIVKLKTENHLGACCE